MTTAAGVGRSISRDSALAGRTAVEQALAPLSGRTPDVVLLFATAGHALPELVAAASKAAGGARLTGCSGEGVITHEGSDEGSHCVGAMAIASDEATFHTAWAQGAGRDPQAAAAELAQQLTPHLATGKLLLVFPDGLTVNCAALLQALRQRLDVPCGIAGGTAGEMLAFERTFQFHGDRVFSDGVAAVLIGGDVVPELGISHGCDLIGLEQLVTKAEGGLVQAINGRPSWDFFKDFLDDSVQGLDGLSVSHLALAEKLPGGALPEYGTHAIRVPLRLDETTGAMFFAAGLKEGSRVQPALRNPERIAARAVNVAKDLASRHPGRPPLLVLQFDCAGRGQVLYGGQASKLLIAPQVAQFPEGTPWLGLHTYGEIAPVRGEPWFHNFTAVLCALYAA